MELDCCDCSNVNADILPYAIPHVCIIIFGGLTFLFAFMDEFKISAHNDTYLGFVETISALTFLYGIIALFEDFKRDSHAWTRAHMTFLYCDLVIIMVTVPLGVVGAIYWHDDAQGDAGKYFDKAVTFLWITFAFMAIITFQDNYHAEQEI